MINTLRMQEVASYRNAAAIETDKKINLVYGLNGTGKSTISDFLYDQSLSRFESCRIAPPCHSKILVYNQTFVREHFHVSDSLKGIFSLSKENKEAEQKVAESTQKIADLQSKLTDKRSNIAGGNSALIKQKQTAADKTWEIKTEYVGGDRVLEYCLSGLKGQKEKLFEYLALLPKPGSQPETDAAALKSEVEALGGDDAQHLERLKPIAFKAESIEVNPIFRKPIVGNEDSVVASLIEKLNNSDWVREGLEYIPKDTHETKAPCPFCQENTIGSSLVENINKYFDESFRIAISEVKTLEAEYQAAIEELPPFESYSEHPLAAGAKAELKILYDAFSALIRENSSKVTQKLKNPRVDQDLISSSPVLAKFNEALHQINSHVDSHNSKIDNKGAALEAIRVRFWAVMRWKYDQVVERFQKDSDSAKSSIAAWVAEVEALEQALTAEREKIVIAQKGTVNIHEAVASINAGLLDLAIDAFTIKKHSDTLYRIVRSGESDDAFSTLSEGERMIISFLYFCELCKGKASADDTSTQRIAVIDDPISSLSHIYVFNIAQLIRNLFFRSTRFEQVFILTHSLYFFYELTDTNHERRKETQNLFRIFKNSEGSQIRPMKYEEIQNDYQSYWQIIKDESQPPALVANCMRHVVEYFFNFVKKKDLNNVFQQPALSSPTHQAFCRYINRESHSLGQNIFDIKEFDYQAFRNGLRLVFEETGYGDHYAQMMKT